MTSRFCSYSSLSTYVKIYLYLFILIQGGHQFSLITRNTIVGSIIRDSVALSSLSYIYSQPLGLIVTASATVYTANTFVGAGVASVLSDGDTISNGLIYQLNFEQMLRGSGTIPPPPLSFTFTNGIVGRALLSTDLTASINIYGTELPGEVNPLDPRPFAPIAVLISKSNFTNTAITIRDYFPPGSNFTLTGNRFTQKSGDPVGSLSYYINLYCTTFTSLSFIVHKNVVDYKAAITSAVTRGFINIGGGYDTGTLFKGSLFAVIANTVQITTRSVDKAGIALVCFGFPGSPPSAPLADYTYSLRFVGNSTFISSGNSYTISSNVAIDAYMTIFGILSPFTLDTGSTFKIEGDQMSIYSYSSQYYPVTILSISNAQTQIAKNATFTFRYNLVDVSTDVQAHVLLFTFVALYVQGGGTYFAPLDSYFLFTDNTIYLSAEGDGGSSVVTLDQSQVQVTGTTTIATFVFNLRAVFSISNNDVYGADTTFLQVMYTSLYMTGGAGFLVDSNVLDMRGSTVTSIMINGVFTDITISFTCVFSVSYNLHYQNLVSSDQYFVVYIDTDGDSIQCLFGGAFRVNNNTFSSMDYYSYVLAIGGGSNSIAVSGAQLGEEVNPVTGQVVNVLRPSSFSISGNTITTRDPTGDGMVSSHIVLNALSIRCESMGVMMLNSNTVRGGQPEMSIGIFLSYLAKFATKAQLQMNGNTVVLASSVVFMGVGIMGYTADLSVEGDAILVIQGNNVTWTGASTIDNSQLLAGVMINCYSISASSNGTYLIADNLFKVSHHSELPYIIAANAILPSTTLLISSNSQIIFRNNNATFDRNEALSRSLSTAAIYSNIGNVSISSNSFLRFEANELSVRSDVPSALFMDDTVSVVVILATSVRILSKSGLSVLDTTARGGNASTGILTGVSLLRSPFTVGAPTYLSKTIVTSESLAAAPFDLIVTGNSSIVVKGVRIGGMGLGDGIVGQTTLAKGNAVVAPSIFGISLWYFSLLIDQQSRLSISSISVTAAKGSNQSVIDLAPVVVRVAGGSSLSLADISATLLPIFTTIADAYPFVSNRGFGANGLSCISRAVEVTTSFIEVTSNSSISFANLSITDASSFTGAAELCRSMSTVAVSVRPYAVPSGAVPFVVHAAALLSNLVVKLSSGSLFNVTYIVLNVSTTQTVTSSANPFLNSFTNPLFHLSAMRYRTNIALVSFDLEGRFVNTAGDSSVREQEIDSLDYSTINGRMATIVNDSKLIIDKSSSLEVSACSWGVGFGRSDVAADTYASILLAPAPPNEGMPSRGAPLDRIVGVSINAQNISLETAASNSMAPLAITQVKGMAVNALHRFDDVDVSKISVSRAAGDPKASYHDPKASYHGEVVGVEVYCETLQVAGQGSVAAISITNTTLTTLEGSDSIIRNGNVLIPAYSSIGGSGSTAARPLAGQQGTIDGIRVTVNNYTQLGPSATTVLNVARNTIDISEFASFRNYYSMDALAAATPLTSLGSGIAVSFANPTWIAPTLVAALFSIANGLSKGAVSISENIIRSTSSPLCAVARSEEALINLRTRGGIRVDLRGTQSSVNGVGTALNVSIQGNSIDLLSAEAADLFSSQCPHSSSLLPLAYYYPTAESYANTTVTRPPPWALNQCPMPVAEGVGISLNYFPATADPLTVPMLSVAGDIRVKGNSIRSVGMSGGRGGVRIEMVQPFILSTEPQISSQPLTVTDVSDNVITVANSAHGSSVSTDMRLDPKGILISSVTSRIVVANNYINVSRLMAAPPQLSSVVYSVPLNAEGVARALAATRGLAVSMQFADGWTNTLMSLEMKVENNTALVSTSYAVGSLGHSWKAQSLLSLSRLNSHSVTGEKSSIALSSNSFSWRSFLEVPSASLLSNATASDRYMSWEAGAPQETEVMATVNSMTLLQVLSALSEGFGEVPEITSLAAQGGMMVNGYYILTAQNTFGGPAKAYQSQQVAWPSTLTKASLAASKGTGMLFANSFTFTNGGRYEAACNSLYMGAASSIIRSYTGLFGSPGVLDLVECDATETLSLAVSRSLAITKTVIGTTTPPTTTTAEPLKCNQSLVERLLLPILSLWADLELTDTQVKEGSHSVSVPLSDASTRFFSKNSRVLSDYVASLELSDPILDYLPLMSPIPQVPILRVGGVSVHPLDPNDLNVERNGFGGSSAETHFPSLRPDGYFSISLSQAAVDSFKLASQQGSQSYTVNFSATPSYSIALGERLELFTNAGSLIEAAWAHFIDKEAVAMLANGSAYNGRESPRTQAARAVYSQLEASVFGQGCIDYYKMSGSSLYVGSVKVMATKDPFADGLSVGSSAIGGSTSVIGILSSSFLAASDLQSLAAMALHSCSDSEMKASFGSYRTLSPFALWDSYFGVIVGNLAAAGVVFSAQLVALVIIRFVRKMSDSSELTAIARFPGYTLNTLFALLSGTVYAAARMASLPDPKLEETILGSIVVALSILFPVMLGVFAYKRIARAYQEYALDDWAAEKGIARWKLALVPEGVVYSPETRASYQGYISTSRRPEAYWPTYATWGSLIILIGGLARPSSTAGCVGLFGAMSALYLAMAVVVITMRPFRSTLLNAFEFLAKFSNFCVMACLAVSVYSGDEVGKAATASVIFGLLQVVLTIFRLIHSVLLIYFDRRMLEDAVGLTIVWSHLTDTGAAKRKLFGITEDSETLLNLGLVANTRNLDDHDDGDTEMKSFVRVVVEKSAHPESKSDPILTESVLPALSAKDTKEKQSPRLRGASTVGYATSESFASSPLIKAYSPPAAPMPQPPPLEDLELDVEDIEAVAAPPVKSRSAIAKPVVAKKSSPKAESLVDPEADLVIDEGPALTRLAPQPVQTAPPKRKKSIVRPKGTSGKLDNYVVSAGDAEDL